MHVLRISSWIRRPMGRSATEVGWRSRLRLSVGLLLAGLLCGGVPATALSAPGHGTDQQAEVVRLPADVGAESPAHAASARSLPVTWFGYVDDYGQAVAGEMWTFDHDGTDPFEGWAELPPPAETFPWRRIDTTSWSGHDNQVPAPILNGAGSAWVGYYQDEAEALDWVAGLGYGNEWCYRFQSPIFTWDEGGSISLSYDYWTDLESGCDYVHVYLRGATLGGEIELASYTGVAGDYSSPESESLEITAADFMTLGESAARIVLEISSDQGWSDEDGDYPTDYGPFGIDDIALADHVAGGDLLFTFDTGDEGFEAYSCDPPSLSFFGIAALDDYGVSCLPVLLSGNILHMHDGDEGHPDGQYTTLVSPPATLPETGCTVLAEADIYADMAYYAGVFYRFGWMYTLDGATWSERVGDYMWKYQTGPACSRLHEFGGPYVPPEAVAVKLVVELISDCAVFGIPEYQCLAPGNFSPLFDNLRIGAIDPDALQVPSGDYPTIQAAIDASDATHYEIVLHAGVYSGAGNAILSFNGKSHPVHLHALFGPRTAVIAGDETYDIGINMIADDEPSAVLLDGLTLRGFDSVAIYYDNSSRPLELEQCTIYDCQQGIDLRDGSVTLTDCAVRGNGGGCDLIDCDAVMNGCTIAHNGTSGVDIAETSSATLAIERSILWGNGGGDLTLVGDVDATVYGSAVDPSGVDDPGERIDWGDPDENVYIDPFFCDPAAPGRTPAGAYYLDAVSPCLPAYSPSGEQLGALPAGCDEGLIAITPIGSDVEVALEEIAMTFATVSTAGDTRRLTGDVGPEVPAEYLLVPADPPEYHALTTTAAHSGEIEICVGYDEGDVTIGEDQLKLLHFDATLDPPAWIDITSSIDVELNTICGTATTLSPFVVAESDVADVRPPVEREALTLYPSHPNPCGGSMRIRYELPNACDVTVAIYNVAGQRVRLLRDQKLHPAGRHELEWDGCNERGVPVASGCYFYRLQAGATVVARQMLLMR